MYEIFVESEDFRGKKQVHQHRLINQVRQLNDQLALRQSERSDEGLTLETSAF